MGIQCEVIMEEINKILNNKDFDLLKKYLDKRDLSSKDTEYTEETLFMMRCLLSSNNMEVITFAFSYFPKEYLNHNNYFFNGSYETEESFQIYKFLYNYYEKNLTPENKIEILKNAFNGHNTPWGDLRVCKFLIEEKNYDINWICDYKVYSKLSKEEIPFTYYAYTTLIASLMIQDIEKIKYILKETKFNLINFQDQDGKTALHHANENIEIIKLLLEHGADTEIRDKEGKSLREIILEKYQKINEINDYLLKNKSQNKLNQLLFKETNKPLKRLDLILELITSTPLLISISAQQVEKIFNNYQKMANKKYVAMEKFDGDYDKLNEKYDNFILFMRVNENFTIEQAEKISKQITENKNWSFCINIDTNILEPESYIIFDKLN